MDEMRNIHESFASLYKTAGYLLYNGPAIFILSAYCRSHNFNVILNRAESMVLGLDDGLQAALSKVSNLEHAFLYIQKRGSKFDFSDLLAREQFLPVGQAT